MHFQAILRFFMKLIAILHLYHGEIFLDQQLNIFWYHVRSMVCIGSSFGIIYYVHV